MDSQRKPFARYHREAQRIVVAVLATNGPQGQIVGGGRGVRRLSGIIFIGEKCVEQDRLAGDFLDLRKGQVLMRKKRGLLALKPFEKRRDRLRRMKLSACGRGGDQKAEDALDAWNQCLASGTDIAVDNVVLVGEASQENAPGALQKDGQREAMLAGNGVQPGSELGGERLFELGLSGGRILGCLRRDAGGRFETGQVTAPGVTRGVLILVLKPGEVVFEGRRLRQSARITFVPIEG